MKKEQPLKITFVLAHPDDEHIPFGLPAQLVKQGYDVSFIVLTNGDLGSHTYRSRRRTTRMRARELKNSAKELGIQTKHVKIINIHDGELDQNTRKARMKLLEDLRRTKPRVVIVHDPFDYHHDHRAAFRIAEWAAFHMPDSPIRTRRGFFREVLPAPSPIFYTMDTQDSQTRQSITQDTGQNNDHLNPVNTVIPISEEAIAKSVTAFNMHKSQLGPRGDGQIGYVELARLGARRRGQQIGTPYAVGLNVYNFGGYAFPTANPL